MIIGVDIDGVLTNLYSYCAKKSKEFFKKEKPEGEKFKKSTCLYQLLGMTKEQDKRFWKEYIWAYSKDVKFYKQASKFLNKLREEGHQIYIITLRQYFGTGDENSVLMENIIKETFANNGIVYDKLFGLYGKREKLTCVLENNVEVMIDDSYENLSVISPHVPCICFDAKYNHGIKLDNMTRCKNWKQVYKALKVLGESKLNEVK